MAVINIGADVSPAGLSAFDQAIMGAATPTVGSGTGGFFNNLLTGIGDLPLSGLAQTGLSYAALDDVMDRLSSVGSGLATGAQRIGEEAAAGTAFRPFTVSTGFGGVTTTPEGGFTTSLSPAQAAQQQQLQALTGGLVGGMGAVAPDVSGITGQALGGLSGALTGLMAPMGQREADVYERIRATQRPEEERDRLALEERLQSQGRTGLRTAQFGGAPEQLALAQAQEEAKNRAALSALEQSQAEQMQQLGIAQGLFGLGSGAAALPASLQLGQLQNIGLSQAAQYLPEQQLLSSLTPAINIANIAGTGQRQGAGYLAEAGISGLESQAQTELARANLLGQIYSSMLGAAGATGAAEAGAGSTNDLIGSIFGGETLGGLFSSIFN
jgi:hypothetical protein